MRKLFFIFGLGIFMPVVAQNNDAPSVAQVLESRIQKRETPTRDTELAKHEQHLLGLPAQSQATKRNSPFLSLQEAAKRTAAKASEQGKQKLDSLVVFNGDKTAPVSKQYFVYTETGLPSICYNYLPDESMTGKWHEVGQYRYSYDSRNRLVEAKSLTDSTSGFKYEYVYTNDNQPYTGKFYSILENGECTLSEKAEYAYDDNGMTTLEAYYSTEDNGATWVGAKKVTATYNEAGIMTSDYTYAWDSEKADWVGDNLALAHNYYYRADGQDDWIETFYWENGKWSNYYREYYTYDDKGHNVKYERTYWNREHQDWLGGDKWGSNEIVENNTLSEYVYDDKGRNTLEWAYFRTRNTDYKPNFKRTRDYTELENGRLKNEEKVYYKLNSDEFEVYNHRTIITNSYGAECYYLNRQYMGAGKPLMKTEEIVRDIDDSDNRYNGGVFYAFTLDSANTRYGQTKETNFFDENGNRYMTTHQRATKEDTTWVDYDKFLLTWENDGTGVFNLVGVVLLLSVNGEYRYLQGYLFSLDYSIPVKDLILWPISNIDELYYKYKVDECSGWVNYDINKAGDDSVQETVYAYYYSPAGVADGISNTSNRQNGRSEVARYDLSGRRVAQGRKGLLIVKYSDGSVEKKMVR